MGKTVRIGNSSGFWGDEPKAMLRQVEKGELDYLVADYLAEVSMSILHKQMMRQPEQGYVADFVEHLALAGSALKVHFPKIVTNAGGKNPIECAKAVQVLFQQLGIQKKVIAITGDDLMPAIDRLSAKNEFENLETGDHFDRVANKIVVANAYTSSEGIVQALSDGADVVITGRASDSALTIGPLVYELGWDLEDWDLMAAGMLAGHVLECGSQASGGNFTDWHMVPSWDEMGYPIVEMREEGSFVVTKAKGTGGLVNQWTVKEQLVYEIADPSNYMGPDVVADLTQLTVEDIGENRVLVENAKGHPPPNTWKVSMAYKDGFKAVGTVVVGGENALQKAQLVNDIFWKRFGFGFDQVGTNYIGANALGTTLISEDAVEIVLQFVAFDTDRSKLEVFSKEVAGLILAGPQGLAAAGGRPKIQEVISYWPTLVDKSHLTFREIEVLQDGSEEELENFPPIDFSEPNVADDSNEDVVEPPVDLLAPFEGGVMVDMKDICLARSGDKGNSANIGVLVRSELMYGFLKENLSADIVKGWFGDYCRGDVVRYRIKGMNGFNFFLTEILDGGGTNSGRIDPQGKMLAARLLTQKLYVPAALID